MRSASRTVDSRCAMTIVVRPARSRRSAAKTISSEMASSDEVGSSRIRIGAFFRIARATLSRWRSPPDRPPPASATRRVVALRQPRDELVRVRGARRLLDLVVGRVEPAVAEVVGDRAGEQHRILQHDRDLLAQRSHAVVAHVDAVDRARGRRSASKNRGIRLTSVVLPAPVRPTSATISPGPGLEGDVVQHRGAVGIGEADVLEADVARDRRTRRSRPARRRSPASARTSRGRAARRRPRPAAGRSCARSPTAGRRPRRGRR